MEREVSLRDTNRITARETRDAKRGYGSCEFCLCFSFFLPFIKQGLLAFMLP